MNTPGQSTVAATLDAIDAATEQMCACGCQRVLDPAGPSAYYASPDCQRDYLSRQAADPDDVYDRADAAAYVGSDSAAWPLSEPGEAGVVRTGGYWPLTGAGIGISAEDMAQDLTNWMRATIPNTDVLSFAWTAPESDGPPAGPPYTHRISGGGTPSFTVTDWEPDEAPWPSIRQLMSLADRVHGPTWPPEGTHRVRIYSGGGTEEIGTLTPDPDGDVTMSSGRFTFTPRLCPEHARQAQAELPADPMERALWLRRNRNTGPRRPDRAPRRIDPRRGR